MTSPQDWSLGIDLGTTFTSAAIYRGTTAEPVMLGSTGWSIPSVVHLPKEGDVVVGESAAHVGATQPERTFAEFKRDFGQQAPVVTPDGARTADWFMLQLLTHTLATVEAREGGSPSAICITHPASWGEHRLDLLRQCAESADIDATFLAEPIAAATHYAACGRLSPGETVAIYDFGGGTFDASIVRHNGSEIEVVGHPSGVDALGGIDFDRAIFALVDDRTDGLVSSTDATDHALRADLYTLLDECRRCKISLTDNLRAPIRVRIGAEVREVMVQRAEFEALIEPLVLETLDELFGALSSAQLEISELSRVLLVGGSSRVPLVGQVVSNTLRIPISVDIDAASAIAQGAALHAGGAGLRFGGEDVLAPSAVRTPASTEGRHRKRFVNPGETLGRSSTASSTISIRTEDGDSVATEPGEVLTVGRSLQSDLVVAANQVSRLHGRVIEQQPGEWQFIDTSSNGTYVDGEAIDRIDLVGGLQLQLGTDGPLLFVSALARGRGSLSVEVGGQIVYPVTGRRYVIGRRPPADIVVADPDFFVSTSHLELLHDGEFWNIRDTSTNGTYYPDGRQLDGSLHPITGDVQVSLGTSGGPTVAFQLPDPASS